MFSRIAEVRFEVGRCYQTYRSVPRAYPLASTVEDLLHQTRRAPSIDSDGDGSPHQGGVPTAQ